ncbi:Tryptophan synthase beta subunit-like PLP-dependent enzymes superfamily [Penicillium griseofulvum]|uniref:Tryptophan synthase beta subunit-like PLP-dependent enzymes superfamily n=1 Tax=Penicillium patulum TaxID=5078 RepID=A0A135LZX4_PENPA|nr:Tryptophan synthase beta subunit-like PLP-dependent enzymes superfamily [Penicillium griseofulvum]KXG54517.1 Tryptophan synthase beta subunit-like PLP-dependent enzymes superfamily [Penicillium griseofulvum]
MAQLSTCLPLTKESTLKAHELIKPQFHPTPVLTSRTLNEMASTPRAWQKGDRQPAKPVIRLWFKCENLQRIGAFKARGAFHAIERLKQDPSFIESGGMEKGVVGFSAGNHAQALALAAKESGIPAYIVMPDITRLNKIAATKGYGANVIGARLVPPFNHPDVILGQTTAGLELQEQADNLDAIIASCSGGGLLAGTALSCEKTSIRVFGAEPEFEGADDCRRGFLSGERITSVNTNTIADGLIGVVGEIPWSVIYVRKLVDGMFAVSEEQILEATRLIFERLKMVVEPAAAVTLAVVLYNEEFRQMVEKEAGDKGWDLGLILSGGNVSAEGLAKLFA